MVLFSRSRSAKHESTIARLSTAKENAKIVIAESALVGERRITIVRIVTIILMSLSQSVSSPTLAGGPPSRDVPRGIAAGLYALFALLMFIHLRRWKPNPRAAKWGPVAISLADHAFVTFMGWRTAMLGVYAPQAGAAIFSLLICFSVARFSNLHVFGSTFLSCFCYMLLAMQFSPGELHAHLLVLGVLMALGILIGMTQLRTRKMFLDLRRRDMLTRFLPKQIVDRVVSLGDTSLQPVQREVTVMFTDIRDFTTLSESLPPNVVLSFLDEYFGHMSHLVKAHDGLVNKFLGDGMLAFWGVPERLENHAGQALRAALDMRKVVAELNDVRQRSGAPPIRIGIGVHTGTVAAGMLGGADQHEYTVIGDAVNLTSRIEGLTKSYGVDILVSESTWALVRGRFRGERIGECTVKGRQQPVVVYRLDDVAPSSENVPAQAAAGA